MRNCSLQSAEKSIYVGVKKLRKKMKYYTKDVLLKDVKSYLNILLFEIM
jgi:hypothetical protein